MPIKSLFFIGVAIIKPDLPIIFWISPAIRHLVVAPSQAGLVEDGPGMGNRASQQNGCDPRAWRHLYHSQDISVSLSPSPSHHFLPFFLFSHFNDFSSPWAYLLTSLLLVHFFFEWTTFLCSPPCISFLIHSLKLFLFKFFEAVLKLQTTATVGLIREDVQYLLWCQRLFCLRYSIF